MALSVLLLITYADLTGFLFAHPTRIELFLFKHAGLWSTYLFQDLLFALPIGVLAGAIFARRPLIYSFLAALLMCTLPLALAFPDLSTIQNLVFVPLLCLAGSIFGARIKHPYRIPLPLLATGVSRKRLIVRAVLDLLVLLFAFSAAAVLRNYLIGHKPEGNVPAFWFYFSLLCLVMFARYQAGRPKRYGLTTQSSGPPGLG